MAGGGQRMSVHGSRLYGKVDRVEGLFFVATRFIHFCLVPLIPTDSYLVFSQAGDCFRGVTIPLSGKSILVAWMRAMLLGVVFFLMVAAVKSEQDGDEAHFAMFFGMAAA